MNNTDFTTVTITVKKHFYEGNPCCHNCQFFYAFTHSFPECVVAEQCAALDRELVGSSCVFKEKAIPPKDCPVHYPSDSGQR